MTIGTSSPAICSVLSGKRLPFCPRWYKLELEDTGIMHSTRPAYMNINATPSMVDSSLQNNGVPILTITVESRDYAPPLCMLGLGKSGEGAYTRDPNISV